MQDRFEEIKNSFLPRFWDTENKNMSYPYWNDYSNNFFYPYDKSTEKDSCDDWDDIWLSDILINPRFIRMRTTGLKDKNGKLIYEGDILEYKNEIRQVVYCQATMQWGVMSDYYTIYGNNIKRHSTFVIDCIIIGNIYENSELLGDVK